MSPQRPSQSCCLTTACVWLVQVNSTIDAVISTHHVVTLADLESLVLATNESFGGAASFDALKLGPFVSHPKVRLTLTLTQ